MIKPAPHTPASIYNRLRNRTTQTDQVAQLQKASGELWGDVPKNGGAFLCVQAYRGSLGNNLGIEFTTAVPPTLGSGSPLEARWLYCDGVVPRCSPGTTVNAQGYAVIPVRVSKVAP